jgi:hypothetical protein
VLNRVVRAQLVPEVDLVSSWGMGPWAALNVCLCRGVASGDEAYFALANGVTAIHAADADEAIRMRKSDFTPSPNAVRSHDRSRWTRDAGLRLITPLQCFCRASPNPSFHLTSRC